PSQPPIKTKPNNCYVAKLVEPYCHCDFHLYEPEMGRYMKLAEKEKVLYEELDNLKKRMAVLVGDILDHPCDTDDEKMKTIYETDYVKRGMVKTNMFLYLFRNDISFNLNENLLILISEIGTIYMIMELM
ncbi:hypothetical protein GWI33_007279, partial [Rhynchophorus ferrugineus]